ncbi:MAG: type IV pili methyl-accepting chemotaxis transducer N-terminal domain-containing protein [Pseudomonadota bacterium]
MITRLALSVATALTLALSAPAHAAGGSGTGLDAEALLKDLGAAERIAQSGKLRMLSQRIAATACNRVAGILVEDADKHLTRSVRDYRRILAGLEKGDDGLGLYGAETDRKILRDVAQLGEIWAPLDATFETTANAELSPADVVAITQTAPALLDISKRLVGIVAAEYSDPTQMVQSDAILLQIAERQRMLEQEIANATCMIAEGIEVETAQDKLAAAADLYEISLGALRNGMPEAGVSGPPTQAIDLWLGDIAARWTDLRPTLDAFGQGQSITPEDRAFVFSEMNKLTWMMNVTVGQYTEASKLKF